MTDETPSFPPDGTPRDDQPTLPPPFPGALPGIPAPERLPFSKPAIWGFVIACVSLFVFGFIGALGAAISARGFRAARQGIVRGRGLAIAGMIIGTVGFLYYAVVFILTRFH
ncbi:DUF4190 domain-containing protein [Leifsonia sp. 21MFCrub1.1]|uniref:DUF4190 domain-containing protein n=1 Tax=Leifsonia sp. 21MFCrub1.1 TaxID=1798223 RepID=UPI00089298E8|nr:DUF4190 domain-containing protein [Leifsonia sp. 21MFCrub1.1]SEA36048.1 hypothetical protein SAMN04515680_0128 [Leifsonia sp. 21MFCrub1.1]